MAIVTSLFCEKVAVDAMIEEKTTYVKYKTEGEVHFLCFKLYLCSLGNTNTLHARYGNVSIALYTLHIFPFKDGQSVESKDTFLLTFFDTGESQVYTLGRIGRFKVVSTKLSRKSSSEQEARICDENTITRLLGKIYYNFIISYV